VKLLSQVNLMLYLEQLQQQLMKLDYAQ